MYFLPSSSAQCLSKGTGRKIQKTLVVSAFQAARKNAILDMLPSMGVITPCEKMGHLTILATAEHKVLNKGGLVAWMLNLFHPPQGYTVSAVFPHIALMLGLQKTLPRDGIVIVTSFNEASTTMQYCKMLGTNMVHLPLCLKSWNMSLFLTS